MLVHIDGDVLVYRAGYSVEHTLYTLTVDGQDLIFDGAKEYRAYLESRGLDPRTLPTSTRIYVEDEEKAIYNASSIVRAIGNRLQVPEEQLIVYLSGPDNYRHGVATIKPYKGNRDPTKKPVHGPTVKEWLRARYNCVTSNGQEADDDMAIAHTTLYVQGLDSCIATIDKDLNQVPGAHYNFVSDEAYHVDEDEADRFFWLQMLQGDNVDNVPGVPGIGPAKAEKLLHGVPANERYTAVRKAYERSYGESCEAVMLEMGRLLWIRRKEDEWWNLPTT